MPRIRLRLVVAAAFVVMTAGARAQTAIYDATGGVENGGDSFKTGGPFMADGILTGPAGETLASVVLNLSASEPGDGGGVSVVLTPFDFNGFPGPGKPRVTVGVVADASLTKSFALTTVTPRRVIRLKANTRYFVGVDRHSFTHSSATLGNTVDPSVLARPSVKAGLYLYKNSRLDGNIAGPYEIRINATP